MMQFLTVSISQFNIFIIIKMTKISNSHGRKKREVLQPLQASAEGNDMKLYGLNINEFYLAYKTLSMCPLIVIAILCS